MSEINSSKKIGAPSVPRRPNVMAIAGLVLGIASILMSWTILGGLIAGIAGLITGLIAKADARDGCGGSGDAATAVDLSIMGLVATVAMFFVIVCSSHS